MSSADDDELELIAFHGGEGERLDIVPSGRWRDWMNATFGQSANRCLPLLMANESGWVLCNPLAFTATWTGGEGIEDLSVEYDEPPGRRPLVESNFGSGILTWGIPLLFRTPPGFNLLARGPVNLPKDGASPLEGLVETDWSVSTFTMNWKLTRPGHPVRFEAGEPFCMVVPQRRGELERFRPVHRDLSTEPEVRDGVEAFHASRDDLMKRKFVAGFIGPEAAAFDEWEATYFRGRQPDGTKFLEHQTKLRLRPFGDERLPGSANEDPGSESPAADAGSLAGGGDASRFRVAGSVRYRSFRSATMVLDLSSGRQLELNPVAGRMLELLAGGRTVAETGRIIAARYRQPVSVVVADVADLAGQLQQAGVLEPDR